MPKHARSVHLTLIAVQLCFASLAVVGREALAHIPANAIVLCRVGCAALLFAAIARFRDNARIERADLPRLVLCALLGVVVNQTLFVNGLARSSAINASVLGTTIPIFSAIFAVAAGIERMRIARLTGIALALFGALFLVHVDRFSWDDAHAVGNLMILCNCASYGLFLVLVRPLTAKIPPFTLVAGLFVCALPGVLALGVPSLLAVVPHITMREIGYLAFIIAVPTVGAYGLNQVAMRRAEPSLVASYIYLQPLFATVGAALRLGERLDTRTAIAAPLVLLGVFQCARSEAT